MSCVFTCVVLSSVGDGSRLPYGPLRAPTGEDATILVGSVKVSLGSSSNVMVAESGEGTGDYYRVVLFKENGSLLLEQLRTFQRVGVESSRGSCAEWDVQFLGGTRIFQDARRNAMRPTDRKPNAETPALPCLASSSPCFPPEPPCRRRKEEA